jgi:nitrogenase molybdenum-iron protein NifN
MLPTAVSAPRERRRARLELTAEGFFTATRALVDHVCRSSSRSKTDLNIFPGLVSRADLQYLHEIVEAFELAGTIFPDSKDKLDEVHHGVLPDGGTPISTIQAMGSARQSLCLTDSIPAELRPSDLLATRFGVPEKLLPLPIGLLATDRLMTALEIVARRPVSEGLQQERDLLIDCYADAQDALFDTPIAIYGECDWVVSLCAMLAEVNARPVVCATSSEGTKLEDLLARQDGLDECTVLSSVTESALFGAIKSSNASLLLLAGQRLEKPAPQNIPVVSTGSFNDEMLHLGYRGTREIINRMSQKLSDDCVVIRGAF